MRSLEGIPLNGLNLLGGNCEATQLQMISHQPGRQSSAAAVPPDVPRLCIYTTLPAVRRSICWPVCWLAGSLAGSTLRYRYFAACTTALALCCVLFDGLAVHCSLFVRRPPLRLYASPSALGHRQCPCSSDSVSVRFGLVSLCSWRSCSCCRRCFACLALPGWPGLAWYSCFSWISVQFAFL